MAHLHGVIDADKHFVIDAATREITNQSDKITLMQNDHNSERFTFEIPREIDGHDMSLCNVVRVHYLNIDTTTKAQNPGFYEVDDLQINPEDETKIIGSWLISANATKNVGSLNFTIRFKCVSDDGLIGYAWSSAIFKGISIGQSYNNSGTIAEEYADIFAQWQARIEALEQGGTGGGGSGSGLTEEQAADLAANTEARHTHTPENKAALDKFEVGTVPYGAYPFYNGQPLAFLDDIGSGSGSNHEHTHYLEKTSNLHVLNKFSQTKESDSDSYRPIYEASPLAFKKELTTPLESQDDIEKAIDSPDTLTTKLWALNAAGLKRYHDTFVAPLSGGNGETEATVTLSNEQLYTVAESTNKVILMAFEGIEEGKEIVSVEIQKESTSEWVDIRDMIEEDGIPYFITGRKTFVHPEHDLVCFGVISFPLGVNSLYSAAEASTLNAVRIKYKV